MCRAKAPDARALSICTFVLIKQVITCTFVLVQWRKSATRAGSQYVYFCTSTASHCWYFCTSKQIKPVAKSREPSRDSARRAGSRHLKSRCWSLVSRLICVHAYVSIHQHTSAYVSIRQHTSATIEGALVVVGLSLRPHTLVGEGLIH